MKKYVASDEQGIPYHPNLMTFRWGRMLNGLKITRVRLHDARHSCATLMHLRGVAIALIAAWLGHASAAFTMSVYAHSQDDALKSAASSFGRVVTTRDIETGSEGQLTTSKTSLPSCSLCPQSDSNRHCADFKSAASANWAMGASLSLSTLPGASSVGLRHALRPAACIKPTFGGGFRKGTPLRRQETVKAGIDALSWADPATGRRNPAARKRAGVACPSLVYIALTVAIFALLGLIQKLVEGL